VLFGAASVARLLRLPTLPEKKKGAIWCSKAYAESAAIAFAESSKYLKRRFHQIDAHETGAEPGATAQRPQLSRVVLAHAPRQPGSWLICNVSQ